MNLQSERRYSALVQPRLNKTSKSKCVEPFRNSYTPTSQSFLNDPECISLRERFLKGDDPNSLTIDDENKPSSVSIDLLQRLIIHLREFEERCAASANYKDAKQIHSIQLKVKEKIKSYIQNQIVISDFNNDSSNNSDFNNNTDFIENLRKKHEEELKQFDDETIEKINSIDKLHKQSLERFEQSWTEKPQQYRKPSIHLIELKKTEQALAKIGQYDSATQVNIEALNLAKEEAAEKQRKILSDYRNAKKKLLTKQQNERQNLISNRADQRLIIQSKHEREIESANNRKTIKQHHSQLVFKNSSRALSSVSTANSRSTSNVDTASTNTSSIKIPSTKKAFVIPASIGSRSAMRCRIYSLPPSAKANIWAQNAINGNRSSSVSNTEHQNPNNIFDQQPSLLPPLIPPTDPSIIENEEKEKKEKIKLVQQAKIRREKEKRRRMELMQEEMEREKQIIEEQKRKIQRKNNNKKKVVDSSNQNDIVETVNNADQEIEKNDVINDTNDTNDSNNNSKTEKLDNLNKDAADNDSEYYYYEEEEEIIEEEEESKEDSSPFVPISSCGSSSFHNIPSINSENPLAETNEVISKIKKNKNKNDISNHNKNRCSYKDKTDNTDTDTDDEIKINGYLQKSKSDNLENKLYDQSDPLYRSVPNLKSIKDNKNDDLSGSNKNFRRFSSNTYNCNELLFQQSSGLTSTSMSDFEMDLIPLDVPGYISGNYTDQTDFNVLNAPLDDGYLNSIEGRHNSLSRENSAHDIKDLTKQIIS